MKRLLVCLLLTAIILSMCGCGAEPAKPAEPEISETIPETTPPTEIQTMPTETEPPILEDPMFLKVSSVTFSLVGETDDIYLGLVPRELVTWESDDPSVVSVENGVLTATGVGTTTVRATYHDRQLTCTAGCLAETQEELDSLDYEIVSAPKRLPPEVDLEAPCTYFDNSAIVGDSITHILRQWESKTNYLGDMLFLARGGLSVNGFVLHYANIYYQGMETYLEDAIGKSQVERMYILLGVNDITVEGAQKNNFFKNWDILQERIREKNPNVEIVIISLLPEYDDEPRSTLNDASVKAYNELMVEYNGKLQQYAKENGFLYLDLSYYIQDHYNRMAAPYSLDHYHLNEAGCLTWMKVLRYYAQYELEGGTLS